MQPSGQGSAVEASKEDIESASTPERVLELVHGKLMLSQEDGIAQAMYDKVLNAGGADKKERARIARFFMDGGAQLQPCPSCAEDSLSGACGPAAYRSHRDAGRVD